MTNLEINKRVAEKLGLRVHENINTGSDAIWVSEDNVPPYPVDYVNCWKDCGPLIEAFNIQIRPTGDIYETPGWEAVIDYEGAFSKATRAEIPSAICAVVLMR